MTSQATGDEKDPPAEQPRPAAAPEPALNPLQRLIQQRLRERGWSYREVARRGVTVNMRRFGHHSFFLD